MIALYRIAQEALQNVVKHAQATQAEVELRCDAARVLLRVTDDGRGFDIAARSRTARPPTACAAWPSAPS